jgi:magnesium transporter
LMDKDNADKVQKIIDQHDENILLFSTQQFMKMPESMSVEDVMANFRVIARDMDVIMYVYVADEQGVLKGVVDFRELLAAEPGRLLGEIMTDKIITLNQNDTLRNAVAMFVRYGFRAIPVIDDQDVLLAVVSFRDIRGIKPRLD